MALVLALAAALVAPAEATTLIYRSDVQLAALSDRVVRGRVLEVRAERQPGGAVLTVARVAVLEDLTGGIDPVIEVRELGGSVDGYAMWVPGAPRFVPGQELVLCLESWRGSYRSVAMAFSAFAVDRSGDAPALRRMEGGFDVVGSGAASLPANTVRTLDGFRATVTAVKGTVAVAPVLPAQVQRALQAFAAGNAAGGPVSEHFTLLGSGFRWRQADTDTAVLWYRNPDQPSPLTAGNITTEIQTALSAWTNPPTARVALAYGGLRSHPGALTEDTLCDASNSGVGIITFDDPGDLLTGSTLAIGGGCGGNPIHSVNGQSFSSFTHGFIVFNELPAGFTTAPNFTRVLIHELGHGIGLGHATATSELMYPSCCHSGMPLPPAIGADDLAGAVFIYPMQAPPPPCTYSINPTNAAYPGGGGSGAVTVTASAASCAWTASSNASWLTISAGAAGTGTGSTSYAVATNMTVTARSGTLTVAGLTFTVSQQQQSDSDNDGLPDWWETAFGLNPQSNAGSNGAGGDEDGDGQNNLAEFNAGTHPRGLATRYLAEGAVNAFFKTEIAILNPTTTRALTLVRIQPQDQAERYTYLEVPPLTRRTLTSTDLAALTGAPFSTVIESDIAIVVDRTMSWDATGYGAHAEAAIETPSTTWYLAEGSTSGEFSLFYLLQNPNTTQTQATVRFLRPAPQPPIELVYMLAPNSRTSIAVDSASPALASTDVSGVITSTLPIIVERSMYLNVPGQPFAAGHESAGVTAPAPSWFLAEGATGTFFELFLLIANPNVGASQVEVDYLLPSGSTITKAYTVAGNSRFSIWVDEEQFPESSGNRLLADTSLAMRVRTINNTPIIVERAMWWPQPFWYEGHNAAGTTVTGTRWALAGGESGGAAGQQTYVLIANTSNVAGTANVTIYREDSVSQTISVPLAPNSRTNVPIDSYFTIEQDRRYGIVVESSGSPTVPQIVVERAMYSNAGGLTWSAGTAAVATRLSP